MQTKRIEKKEANYAQVVIAGYPKENRYGLQLQLKKIDNKGYSKDSENLYFNLIDCSSMSECLNMRDSFKNSKLSDKKIVHGQEVFTYKVELEDALNKVQNK